MAKELGSYDPYMKAFGEQVQKYIRKKLTQEVLAHSVHLDVSSLSKLLHGKYLTSGTFDYVHEIIKMLVQKEIIKTRGQAIELLDLAHCPHFGEAQWAAPPLNKLKNLASKAQEIVTVASDFKQANAGSAHPKNYMPFMRSSIFQSRPGEFERLKAILFNEGNQQPLRLGLIGMLGMGGVGKTQLAIELAYLYKDLFPDGVFWMTATGRKLSDWQRHMSELAVRTDYLPSNDDISHPENELRRAQHLCRYLANHKKALLILDNVQEPNLIISALPTFAGSELSCMIIYTSRKMQKLAGTIQYDVQLLPEREALQLLLRDVRPAVLSKALNNDYDSELDSARKICRKVGYLPLALIHLRSYLDRKNRLSLIRLLQAIEDRGTVKLVKNSDSGSSSLFTTLLLSWEEVNDDNARQFLKLAAFFPEAAPISLWLLGLATGLGDTNDEFGPLEEALLLLQDLNLIQEVSDDQIRVHPLVREFILQLIDPEEDLKRALCEKAATLVADEFEDLNRLEKRTRQVGYWKCLEQVIAAQNYVELLESEKETSLRRVKRWLDLESHVFALGTLWPYTLPGLFYQQLYNRSVEEGSPFLAKEIPTQWIKQLISVGLREQPTLRVLTGHLSIVESIAFSPDGKTVVSGSGDGTVRLWEVESGKEVCVLAGHQKTVRSVAFLPDGAKVISGSDDRTIRLWDIKERKSLKVIEENILGVWRIAVSIDGTKIVSISQMGDIKLWEVESCTLLDKLSHKHFSATSIVFSPDGGKMAIAGAMGIGLWDLATNYKHSSFGTRGSPITSNAVFSLDGGKIIEGRLDGTIHVWSIETQKELYILTGHQERITSVAFSPDGKKAASGSGDHTIRLWEIKKENSMWKAPGHKFEVTSTIFSPDGKRVASGSGDHTVKLWKVENGEEEKMFIQHSHTILDIIYSPDGSKLASSSLDGTVKLWEAEEGFVRQCWRTRKIKREEWEREYLEEDSHDWVEALAFSPDGTRVAGGCRHYHTIYIWNCANGEKLKVLKGHRDAVTAVAFSSDGQLASGSWDETVRLWEVESGKLLRILPTLGFVDTIAFSPDGKKLASGSNARVITLWNLKDETPPHILEAHRHPVRHVEFSPNGQIILSCDDFGLVCLWCSFGAEIGRILMQYYAAYPVDAVYWESDTQIILSDLGGPYNKPHIYRLRLEGIEHSSS